MLLAATFATTAGAAPAAADPAKELPAASCLTVTDPSGDAHVNNTDKVPYDADLDILGLTLRSTATSLVGYVKVADLADGPAYGDGHRYTINFTFNGHVFSLSGSHYKNGTGAVRDALATSGQAGRTTQLGVDTPSVTSTNTNRGFKDSGLEVTFDQDANWVVMELPFADVTKHGGKAFGGTITNVDVRATTDAYAVGIVADTTNPNNTQTTDPKVAWTVGDNRCFTMPTRLTLSVTKFPAHRTVTAKLATAAGQALAGQAVTFYVNGVKNGTRTTASNGTVFIKNVKPGSTVKAVFLATSGYLGSSAQTKV
jgi:hypothetical protein